MGLESMIASLRLRVSGVLSHMWRCAKLSKHADLFAVL